MEHDEKFRAFRLLQAQLSRRGLESEAISLEVALIRGASDGERMELAGNALSKIRAGCASLCSVTLAPFVDDCVAAIRTVHPDYE